MSDFWVFGYGSLMWRPDFPHDEAVPARLFGAHRALCVFSWVHRGTRAAPGLVLGLDRGGSCRGVAFRVAPDRKDEVMTTLREREQVTRVYLERYRPIMLECPEQPVVTAMTYLVDRRHPQYAGALAADEMLAIVRRSEGRSGVNREYVLNTQCHMADMGIRDPLMEYLADALRAEMSGSVGDHGRRQVGQD